MNKTHKKKHKDIWWTPCTTLPRRQDSTSGQRHKYIWWTPCTTLPSELEILRVNITYRTKITYDGHPAPQSPDVKILPLDINTNRQRHMMDTLHQTSPRHRDIKSEHFLLDKNFENSYTQTLQYPENDTSHPTLPTQQPDHPKKWYTPSKHIWWTPCTTPNRRRDIKSEYIIQHIWWTPCTTPNRRRDIKSEHISRHYRHAP